MSDLRESHFQDDYSHPLPDVIYTPYNVPGAGANTDDFDTQFAAGCDCKDGSCTLENSCSCVARFGKNFTDDGRLLSSKFDGPVVECNSECGCFEKGKCRNRLVQYGPLRNLNIISVENKGLALSCDVEIHEGTFICEYAGEVIGLKEAKQRFQSSGPGDMNYVFVLKEHLANGHTLKTCVDPTVLGNIGRYINHSCRPNAAVVPVRVDCPVPKLCVFALRSLEAGEEITFHYGGGPSTEEQCGGNNAGGRKLCLCGENSCNGFLPLDNSLL